MERTFAKVTAEMLGLKLQEAAKLEDAPCRLQLSQVAKDLREALITLGLRQRRVRTKPEVAAKPKGKK